MKGINIEQLPESIRNSLLVSGKVIVDRRLALMARVILVLENSPTEEALSILHKASDLIRNARDSYGRRVGGKNAEAYQKKKARTTIKNPEGRSACR